LREIKNIGELSAFIPTTITYPCRAVSSLHSIFQRGSANK